ncbi:hypothetical protein DLM75_15335 [Leptospira stimsonii]|uniref:Uncharacterized protein n=1 Tax=Leptospira stimsonii TaxID=2202203 RepID=A0A396Z696_9LEPT|nr:hypothetical protein DLM75_15335 [Leptospira stimsonii]
MKEYPSFYYILFLECLNAQGRSLTFELFIRPVLLCEQSFSIRSEAYAFGNQGKNALVFRMYS